MTDVISRIENLMQQRNWTAYRLAKETGLSSSTIINIFHDFQRIDLQITLFHQLVVKGFHIGTPDFPEPMLPQIILHEQLIHIAVIGEGVIFQAPLVLLP